MFYDFSGKQFQFVTDHSQASNFDFHLGVDGLSIYFILLTTLIMPISLISNWKSIKRSNISFLLVILLLEAALLLVFLITDVLLFYVFFESILAPLFILIGMYGSNERVRASFYFFLYTLLGSLFMLLSIITMISFIGTADYNTMSVTNFLFLAQLFLFIGIFIAFAVKTPVIYLNSWLLKAHVESPLSGSIILAAIVLKLSVYGILRVILPFLPKAFMHYTYLIFVIGVVTIMYASLSTIRTIDLKELIAYSSVSHAAVYLIGLFSNTLLGIEGGIVLGIAHGFVSSGLFICAGGILYDRSHTRLIAYYKGLAQKLPLFCVLFFILCLGNCGVPLTLNFIGEFMSLYGVFERLTLAGILASSSIVLSAAFTIFMYNRISFAGAITSFWNENAPDVNKREFFMLFALVLFTAIFGIYSPPILDGLHYIVGGLITNVSDSANLSFDTPEPWGLFFQDNASPQMEALEELHNNIMFYLAVSLISIVWYIPVFIYHVLFQNGPLGVKTNNPNTEPLWFIVPLAVTLAVIVLIYMKFGGGVRTAELALTVTDADVCKDTDVSHLKLDEFKAPFNAKIFLTEEPHTSLFYPDVTSLESLDQMHRDIQKVIALEDEASAAYEMWMKMHDSSVEDDEGEFKLVKSYGLLLRNMEAIYRFFRPEYQTPVEQLWYED
jgi:NADH-ubiquinone oxidoreductase chain 4